MLELRHIVRGVATVELVHGVDRRILLRPLPEKISAKRLGEFRGEHVPACRSRGERGLVMDTSRPSIDRLRR